MKDSIISKVAAQASDFYAEAHTRLVPHGEFNKAWVAIAKAKQSYFLAEASYR